MRNGYEFKAKSKKKSMFEHGGQHSMGKRKESRPLDVRKTTHLVLKSNQMKSLGVSFLRARAMVDQIIRAQAETSGVKIYSLSINSNHCHLAIHFKRRHQYVRFIRAVTGHIVLGLSKLFNRSLKGMFDLLPYTRIVSWGRDCFQLLNYIEINRLESHGYTVDRQKKVLKEPPKKMRQLSFN